MSTDFTDDWLVVARTFPEFAPFVTAACAHGMFRYSPVTHLATLCPWPFTRPTATPFDPDLFEPLSIDAVRDRSARRYQLRYVVRWKPAGRFEGAAEEAATLAATILEAVERRLQRGPGSHWPRADLVPHLYLADRIRERLGPDDPELEQIARGRFRFALARGPRRVLAGATKLGVVDARFDDTTPQRETCDYEELTDYDAFLKIARAWLAGETRPPLVQAAREQKA